MDFKPLSLCARVRFLCGAPRHKQGISVMEARADRLQSANRISGGKQNHSAFAESLAPLEPATLVGAGYRDGRPPALDTQSGQVCCQALFLKYTDISIPSNCEQTPNSPHFRQKTEPLFDFPLEKRLVFIFSAHAKNRQIQPQFPHVSPPGNRNRMQTHPAPYAEPDPHLPFQRSSVGSSSVKNFRLDSGSPAGIWGRHCSIISSMEQSLRKSPLSQHHLQ